MRSQWFLSAKRFGFDDIMLTLKAPNTTIAEFANTVDSVKMVHNEQSHLDLQTLSSSL